MKFNILTIFPDIITAYSNESILYRAQDNKHITIAPIDIRDFSEDKHNTVDDKPYGGGAGMLMKPEPIYRALQHIDALPYKAVRGLKKISKVFDGSLQKKKKTIYLSPRGKQFDQTMAKEWARLDELTLICGRYEGMDERVVEHMVDEEVSIGPYVLAGGELGALVIIEAVARNVAGVLGNPDSLTDETHEEHMDGEYPQYTRPQTYMGWEVPSVLLSGDHKKITDWRKKMSKKTEK